MLPSFYQFVTQKKLVKSSRRFYPASHAPTTLQVTNVLCDDLNAHKFGGWLLVLTIGITFFEGVLPPFVEPFLTDIKKFELEFEKMCGDLYCYLKVLCQK